MKSDSKIYVAGHSGLVGSAIVRNLQSKGFDNIIYRSHSELDLTNQAVTGKFFEEERPEYVFLAAAKVGGIHANSTYPADFIMQNLQIQCNVIESSYRSRVKRLMFLGSSCIYPKMCPQPIKEEYLLTGPLEPTNEAYALAKISGLKMCQFYNVQYGTEFLSVMPANLYGPNDNFDPDTSHVIPALLGRIYSAKLDSKPVVDIWGTGEPLREFLHVDDLADACVFLMEEYNGEGFVNVGTGKDISIRELALMIKEIVNYSGELVFDSSKPNGTPRKLLDVSKLKSLGWEYKTDLYDGLKATFDWSLMHKGGQYR